MEDFDIGSASVKLLLPVLKMSLPEIVDTAMPADSKFHNRGVVSIKKTCPMRASKSMLLLPASRTSRSCAS